MREEVLEEVHEPLSILLGIVFDTKTRKVLIIKEKGVGNVVWSFPRVKVNYAQDLEQELKNRIKEKIGLEIESLGSVFAEARFSGRTGLLSVYYLCEVIGGNERKSKELKEIKWVNPEEVEIHFGAPIHQNLKEYLMSIK